MKKKPGTLFTKVLLILCAATLLEGALFISSLYISKTFDTVQNNTISLFEQRNSYRGDTLQKTMMNDLYRQENYQKLLANCQDIYQHRSTDKNTDELLNEKTLESLLDIIHLRSITGVYVVLDQEVFQTPEYPSLYLRDSSPDAMYGDNSDISGRYGNASLLKRYALTLDSSWMPAMTIDQNDPVYDFYNQPVSSARKNESLSNFDLGYWGSPVTLKGDIQKIITYSLPLIAKDGTVYGIIGIDMTIDYVKSILPYEELNENGQSGYVLARKNNDHFEILMCSGPAYEYQFEQGNTLELKQVEALHTYELKSQQNDALLAHAVPLGLYSSNTPFVDHDWYLISISDKEEMLHSGILLARNSYIAIALAMLVGILAAILISIKFTRPIKKLVNQLQHIDPQGNIALPRVRISEIDELSTSIEKLSISLLGAESRLSQVIHALDLPIGAIESFGKDMVYCTEKVGDLLNFPADLKAKTIIKQSQFQASFDEFSKDAQLYDEHLEEDDGKLIHYYVMKKQLPTGEYRWLRFTHSEQEENHVFIIIDVTKDFLEREKLTYERDHDALTGLWNRNAFRNQVDTLLEENIQTAALVLWDLDNLKFINDTYGHDAGDLLIQTTASILNDAVKQQNAIAARMAGDEFLLFLHHFHQEEEVYHIIEKIHRSITNSKITVGEEEHMGIKVSAGIAWYPKDAQDYDDLMRYSDVAMYDVKNYQKGGIRSFDFSMYQHNKMLFNGRKELQDILDHQLVKYAFQPIVNARDATILGFEALMRPLGTILTSPQDIMRLARAQAQLYRVEYMTWTQALYQFSQQQHTFHQAKLFINSIPSIPLLDELINEMEKKYQKLLPHVVVELIETDEMERKFLQLKQDFMKRWSGQIAIDDFGSGYNSETALLNIAADYIKIDIELIRDIDSDADRKTMVKNIISLAHQRNIKVIAEGIERSEELQTLLSYQVDFLQGYHIAKPDFMIKDLRQEVKDEILAYQKHLNS